MMSPVKHPSVPLRRAIASLLRLADAGVRDARILMKNGSLRNAAMSASSAVSYMAAATVTPERGLPDDPTRVEPQSLDEKNPIRARLEELAGAFHHDRGLLLDGCLPKAPDETALLDHTERAVALLDYLSKHFEVDLGSEEPAGAVSPVRFIPVPERSAPLASQADVPLPVPAQRKPTRRKKPDDGASNPANPISKPKRGKVPAAAASSPSLVPVPPPSASQVSSTVFWSLMDRWGVSDLDALALLGHAGGLTQKGTRPRFKLSKAENEMMAQLQDIDAALDTLELEPRQWLREPLPGAPFSGADPITFVTQHHLPGARELRQHMLQQGLRLSLQQR